MGQQAVNVNMTSTSLDQQSVDSVGKRRATMTDVVIVMGEEKKTFLGVWLIGTALAVGVVLALPRLYSATTVLLPPQQQQSGAAGALAQLGALAGVAGGAMGVKTPDEMYVAFLKTQRLQSALVDKLKLKARYEQDTDEDARYKLSSMVQVSADKKTGLISVTAEDHDSAFAAKLANAHVDELRAMLSSLAVTEAQQRRAFFAQQVAKAQEGLRAAEIKFREEQERNGFVVVQALAESGAKTQVELQSQIASREVQFKALSRFLTPQSQESQRLSAEIVALRQQLASLQSGRGIDKSAANPGQLSAITAYRDMRVQEASLEALVRQLEIAKLDEAKEGPLLQQVDVAQPSDYPSKPKRTFLVGVASLVSFLLAVVLAFARSSVKRRLNDPIAAEQWQRLRRAWF